MHWLSPDQRFARFVFCVVAAQVTLTLLAGARGWVAALLIGCTVVTGAVTALLHACSSSNVEHERQRASEKEDHRAR